MIKVEKERDAFHEALKKKSLRVPTEIVSDDEEDEEEVSLTDLANISIGNTKNYQIDRMFAHSYYFITNVGVSFCSISSLIFLHFLSI